MTSNSKRREPAPRLVDVQVAAIQEQPGILLIVFDERTIAQRMNRQLMSRGVARSVIAMGQVLAHEVKNPLSGIRGAAQLLEQNANVADRELTRLICDESDRIVRLVEQMEDFGEAPAKLARRRQYSRGPRARAAYRGIGLRTRSRG